RPSGSLRVQISPSGLLYNSRLWPAALSGAASFLPSTVILSSALTRSPRVAGLPLTFTRPALIHSSSSRREPRPARASTFWSFSLVADFADFADVADGSMLISHEMGT